jgi:hypothetical protein
LRMAWLPLLKVHSPWSVRPVPTPVAIFPKIGTKLVKTKSTCAYPIISTCRVQTFCRWLYTCFLAVDANFRLKLKRRGINDPEIGSGWSYFVESEKYNEHVSQNTVETEVRPFG